MDLACEYDGTLTEYVFGSTWERRWSYTAPSLARAVRAFRVRTLFPHTYSTAPLPASQIEAPYNLGIGNYLWTASEPGAVIEVCVVPKKVPDQRRREPAQRAKDRGDHYWEGDLTAMSDGHWTHDRIVVARIPVEDPDVDESLPALLQGQMAAAGAAGATALAVADDRAGLQSRGRNDVERTTLDLATRMNELETMKRQLEAQKHELALQVATMRREMERRLEQIWLIELFMGSKEQVKLLRDGDPAPVDAPIAVRQQVLCMDEELAVYTWLNKPETIGEFSWRNIADFDAWLLESDNHVDAVLPHAKGLVALRVRRNRKERPGSNNSIADAMAQIAEDEANSRTYLLVRNGDQLYRLWADVDLWPRLFANDADAERWQNLGKTRWESDREKGRKEFTRYLGGLMVLDGLLRRSDLLHPLPVADLSCFNPKHEGYFEMVHDGENRRMLVDDTDPLAHLTWEGYRSWMNSQLREGLRVIYLGCIDGPTADYSSRRSISLCKARTGYDSVDDAPDRWSRQVLLGKRGEEYEAEEWIDVFNRDKGKHTVTRRKPDRWNFLYLPGDTIYDGWGDYRGHTRSRRVRWTVTANEVLPIDLCSWRVLERLLLDRNQRRYYASYMGAIFGWWRDMRQTEDRERPFVLLALDRAGIDPTEWNVAWGHRLVRWWRMKVKHHRDLGDDEPKAIRMIVGAMKRGHDHDDDPEVALMRTLGSRGSR